MNVLDYVDFNIEDYQPSKFRDYLVNTAKATYNDYVNNRIQERDHFLASVETVVDSFNEQISNYLQGVAFNDDNYSTIVDDLALYVDENNIKLQSKFN